MHMVSVIAVVDLDSEEVVVAQVSSTFTVVLELNMDDIDFNYLPMDVVCNGTRRAIKYSVLCKKSD